MNFERVSEWEFTKKYDAVSSGRHHSRDSKIFFNGKTDEALCGILPGLWRILGLS
jgi:hypothetical protein